MSAVPQQAGSWVERWRVAAADIKVAHSVFALPFAVFAAALTASVGEAGSTGVLVAKFVLVIVCMVAARTWAMLANRLLDRRIDAANTRTARRAFASGRLAPRDGVAMLAASAGVFVLACGGFLVLGNPWPVMLSVPVLAWIAFYSLTKRFTAWCHLVLGVSLAIAPLAASIAVDPEVLLGSASPPARAVLLLLSGFVVLWVAGFDVIYALQDLEYDTRVGLSSVPARLGWRGAIWVSRWLHAGAAVLLAASAIAGPMVARGVQGVPVGGGHTGLGAGYAAGVGAVIGLLVVEHAVLARRGRSGLGMVFFTYNGVISVVLGCIGVVDLLI